MWRRWLCLVLGVISCDTGPARDRVYQLELIGGGVLPGRLFLGGGQEWVGAGLLTLRSDGTFGLLMDRLGPVFGVVQTTGATGKLVPDTTSFLGDGPIALTFGGDSAVIAAPGFPDLIFRKSADADCTTRSAAYSLTSIEGQTQTPGAFLLRDTTESFRLVNRVVFDSIRFLDCRLYRRRRATIDSSIRVDSPALSSSITYSFVGFYVQTGSTLELRRYGQYFDDFISTPGYSNPPRIRDTVTLTSGGLRRKQRPGVVEVFSRLP